MIKKSYETPVMTEFEILMEQAVLNGSKGATTESFLQQSDYDTSIDGSCIWQ